MGQQTIPSSIWVEYTLTKSRFIHSAQNKSSVFEVDVKKKNSNVILTPTFRNHHFV